MSEHIINGIRLRFVTGRMVGVKELGHLCICRPLDGDQPDAISAVASTNGFVGCTAVAKYLGMRPACLLETVAACNGAQKVLVAAPCEIGRRLRGAAAHANTPAFILTPRPPNYRLFDEDAARRLMTEVLHVCTRRQVRTIRFTQFSMLFEPLPLHHLRGVRLAMEGVSQPSSLRQIIFDLDERHAAVLHEALAQKQQRKQDDEI